MVGPIIRLDKSITRAQSLQQVQPCTARGKKNADLFCARFCVQPRRYSRCACRFRCWQGIILQKRHSFRTWLLPIWTPSPNTLSLLHPGKHNRFAKEHWVVSDLLLQQYQQLGLHRTARSLAGWCSVKYYSVSWAKGREGLGWCDIVSTLRQSKQPEPFQTVQNSESTICETRASSA